MKKRHNPGTSNRRTLDAQKLAATVAGPGIDTRMWVSYATVGVLDDHGNLDVTDKRAVYIGPEGVEVDVMLDPSRVPVTCKYNGIQGGCSATVLTPIHPGDRVLVHLPGGDANQMPVIASILHSASCKQPLGPDRKPIFQNDRLMVWADEDLPIDIRNKAGARVQITALGEISAVPVAGQMVKMGSTTASELDDVALATPIKTYIDSTIRTTFNTHTHLSATPGNPTSIPTPIMGPSPDISSSNVKVKK